MKKKYYSFIKLMACCSLALLIAGSLNAQDIIHPTSGSTSVTVFSGTPLSYSDSGGSSGSYSNSESGSVSFCPDSPGEMVTIDFSVVDLETSSSGSGSFAGGCCWDGLTITDANSTLFVGCGEDSGDGGDACSTAEGENGPNDLEPGDSFTSTAANGCLTVDFTSDTSFSETGWEATVSTGGDGGGGCDGNEVTVNLFDSFGDGWNDGILDIVDENDNVVESATLLAGPSGSETFCLPDGCYTVDVSSGVFPNEISWDMYVNGNLELSGGAPESGLELAINTECAPSPTCSDGMQNGNETGIDCGGPDCPACPVEGGLPEPWVGSDVGADCNDFDYDETTGNFTTIGCANNAFPGTTMDNVAFIHQTICGDGEIVAKIESVSPGGYGGLMMRDDLSPGAKQVSVFSNLSNSLRWESRAMTNGSKTVQNFVKPYPIWLKLVRQGDWVFGYYSANGMSFQYVHASYVPMGMCVEVGLAGFSFIPGQDATATYSNVSVVGSGYGVPTAETPGLEVISSARQAVNLFPNPAKEMITIEFEAHATQPTYLNLRNSVGQLMEQRQLEPQSFRTEWGIESLPNGMYTVEIAREGAKTQVLRFVKSN